MVFFLRQSPAFINFKKLGPIFNKHVLDDLPDLRQEADFQGQGVLSRFFIEISKEDM